MVTWRQGAGLFALFLMASHFPDVTRAQDCPVPIGPDGRIDPARMAEALAACATGAPAADAQTQASWAEIADFGRYDPVMTTPEGGGPEQLAGFRHADWAREIRVEIGTIIGLRAAIFLPEGQATGSALELVVLRPPIGEGGERVTELTQKPLLRGRVELHAFRFDTEAEIVEGLWRFEIRHEGRILAAVSLIVVR